MNPGQGGRTTSYIQNPLLKLLAASTVPIDPQAGPHLSSSLPPSVSPSLLSSLPSSGCSLQVLRLASRGTQWRPLEAVWFAWAESS
jgi:hypothetical protein